MTPHTSRAMACGVAIALSLIGLSAANATPKTTQLDKVTLRLKGATGAEFGGYYAAKRLGYYRSFGLDVRITVGAPTVTPEEAVASGHANIGAGWLLGLLAMRDTGTNLVDIAQMFVRSGMTEVVKKSSGISSIADLRGKRVGVWCCGNQLELYASLTKHGMDPEHHKGVTIVNQPFDVTAFLHGTIDAAQALTYDELARILESKNPRTGKLYALKDLNVFKFQDEGTGLLEDELFARRDWAAAHRDVATRFIAASDRGWIYCRDHVQQCTNMVLRQGTALPGGHQKWMMNEINKLIWPNSLGIGIMDPAAFKRTAAIALKYKVIKKLQSSKAYDATLAKAALEYLRSHVKGIDVKGAGYKPVTVTLKAGGK